LTDRGTVLPVLALLLVGGALAVALAVDLGRCGAAWREASFAADAGAEAGAAAIDPGAAYRGSLLLDPAMAEEDAVAAALAVRPRAGRTASAEAEATRVCVTVHQPFPPGLLGSVAVGRVIAAAACASPARG
jgi:hypothetical protein